MLLAPTALPIETSGGVLEPDPDGIEIDFTAPGGVEFWYEPANGIAPKVYRNGVRQREGSSHDFVFVESGGPGTGYDTVRFADPPKTDDNLIIDFVSIS